MNDKYRKELKQNKKEIVKFVAGMTVSDWKRIRNKYRPTWKSLVKQDLYMDIITNDDHEISVVTIICCGIEFSTRSGTREDYKTINVFCQNLYDNSLTEKEQKRADSLLNKLKKFVKTLWL